MNPRFLFLGVALMAMVACAPGKKEKLQSQISQIETSLSMLDITTEDEDAQELISLYVKYADEFPDDSLAPIYIFRAADVSSNLGQYDESINYLDRMIEDYSEVYDDIALCYFLKGHNYELSERFDEAREMYEAYLELFPDHYLAADTRKILPNLGMSPEELLEMLLEHAGDSNIVQN